MDLPAVRTGGLTKRFGTVTALDRLDLEVRQGEVFGFLGPNGAGKTTTLRLLLGLLHPSAGSAEVLGVPVADVVRAHRRMAYLPGDVALWPQLTGLETLTLLGNLRGGVDPALRDALAERFQLDLSIRVRAYSKGNRQKVALVAAFMTAADVLLLDEPTSGLDPLMEAEFRGLVRETAAEGRTVFLSSHLLDEVSLLCDRVGVLREGRLVALGSPAELAGGADRLVLDIRFRGAVPRLDTVPGVVDVHGQGDTLTVQVAGSPGPLLHALAAADVVRLSSREPSLDDMFRRLYVVDAA